MEENAAGAAAVVGVGEVAVGKGAFDVLVRVGAVVAGLAAGGWDVMDGDEGFLGLEGVLVDRDAAGATAVGGGGFDGDDGIAGRRVVPGDAPALALVAVLDVAGVEGVDLEAAVGIQADLRLDLAPHGVFRSHPGLFEVGVFRAGNVALGDAVTGVRCGSVGGGGDDFLGQAGEIGQGVLGVEVEVELIDGIGAAELEPPTEGGGAVVVLLGRSDAAAGIGDAGVAVEPGRGGVGDHPVEAHACFLAEQRVRGEIGEGVEGAEVEGEVLAGVVFLAVITWEIGEDVIDEGLAAGIAGAVGSVGISGDGADAPDFRSEITGGGSHQALVRGGPVVVECADVFVLVFVLERLGEGGVVAVPGIHAGPERETGVCPLGIGITDGGADEIHAVADVATGEAALTIPEAGAADAVRAAAGLADVGAVGVEVIEQGVGATGEGLLRQRWGGEEGERREKGKAGFHGYQGNVERHGRNKMTRPVELWAGRVVEVGFLELIEVFSATDT